ncbi:hypothetical protein E4U55_003998 [Claviceps digitariae]|nr:hypothetical protein E4U55_003998 [Claviceps digitariae]
MAQMTVPVPTSEYVTERRGLGKIGHSLPTGYPTETSILPAHGHQYLLSTANMAPPFCATWPAKSKEQPCQQISDASGRSSYTLNICQQGAEPRSRKAAAYQAAHGLCLPFGYAMQHRWINKTHVFLGYGTEDA